MPPSSLVPSQAEILSAALLALGEARPSALRHAAAGRYGDILKGWAAQYALVRARLAKEVLASRPGTAHGEELRELAESECWRLLPDEPTKAVGEAVLVRQVTNATNGVTGNFTPGVIPAGFRFRKDVRTTELSPDQEPAEYVATEAVYADRDDTVTVTGAGPFVHTQRITVPLEASREGVHANVPFVPDDPLNGLGLAIDAPFDATFAVESLRAAGGSSTRSEVQLHAIARNAFMGNKGPNVAALIVGSLLYPGAHRAVHSLDTQAAVAALFVTDESWATSAAFRDRIRRKLVDEEWVGFGARVDVRGVQVRSVALDVEGTVRDPMALVATADIEAAISRDLRDHFSGERWYTWTGAELRGVAAAADRRILAISNVSVLHGGAAIAEPGAIDPTADYLTHWHVRKGGVRVTLGT